MRAIGQRLRALRLDRNVTLLDLAAKARLDPKTILNAEAGRNPRLGSIVRILRVLGRLDALDAFLPPVPLMPLDLLKRRGRPRQRAWSGRRG